jgi:hypothetical protein
MFRKIWTSAVLLATALGFAATTSSPALVGGLWINHSEPLVRR